MNFDELLKNGLQTKEIKFEDSAIGRISYKMDGQIEELRRIADAAEQRAKLAEEKSKKADVKGWVSVSISFITLLLEVVYHWQDILLFVSQFTTK